ncbi:hypothetical protein ACEPAG_3624 [Sanghuangporus baumii]
MNMNMNIIVFSSSSWLFRHHRALLLYYTPPPYSVNAFSPLLGLRSLFFTLSQFPPLPFLPPSPLSQPPSTIFTTTPPSMSLRHSVRERDVRLHDSHAPPPPPGPLVAAPPGATGPPPPPHAVHLNGNVAGAPPPPPPISNGHGHLHGTAIGHAPIRLSPVAAPAGPPVPHANGGPLLKI